ncbi:hypothetical protein OIU77_030154 [Salix suchowensis]|uniref:Fructose-bisphosphatase n=1 Tax=Salix suchowensis TaxID=1278906 RepID=A0ABQ9BD40_9ROSI|nr:hypothetical protein OIU77_030154 [Salix suchowensis]
MHFSWKHLVCNYVQVLSSCLRSSGRTGIIASGGRGCASGSECLADIGDDSALQLDQSEQRCVVNVCQPGDNLLAAGYCIYSSSVIFIGKSVFAFTLDLMYGELVFTRENIQIPEAGKIYAFDEGNYQIWDDNLKKYIVDLKDPGPSARR